MSAAQQQPDWQHHPLAHWDNVTVRYPYARADAVGPVSLTVGRGERVLLLGPSGSGKSTLLQTLTGIIPQTVPADVEGFAQIGGLGVPDRSPAQWSDTVAQFFQDADRTLTGLRVYDEVAFALENRGANQSEIDTGVAAAMAEAGLPQSWRGRRTSTLSGGEKQLVALAATLIAGADLFIADEPTASLSPVVAKRVYDLVLRDDAQKTVLIVDHRLDQMIGDVDKVSVLGDNGMVLAEGVPRQLFREFGDRLDELGIWTPLASRVDRALVKAGLASDSPPLRMDELARYLRSLTGDKAAKARDIVATIAAPLAPRRRFSPGEPIAALKDAACAPLFGPTVLKNVTAKVRASEVVGIVGPNGAGKSTLGASLAGLLRLKAGTRAGAAGAIAFQNPENQFLEASVSDEITASLDGTPDRNRLAETLELWRLTTVARQHPFELSQGQKRRLALACLTATERWPLLVLDEPTSGLDARGVHDIAAAIGRLASGGKALAVITHDMDFALAVCDRLIVVADGGILAEGSARSILRDAELLSAADLAAPAMLPVLDWLERASC